MNFVSFAEVAERLRGKSVAIVGSGPSCLTNDPGFIDSKDVVVRINNYKLGLTQGFRTDAHYSFYGTSIRKTADELRRDGVTLSLCKCPDAKPLDCAWHEARGKQIGIDFRYIYRNRKDWWFTDTFVPDDARFVRKFDLLDRHIPTTGFAAILDIIDCEPSAVFITGFDFMTSGLHNVNEPWRAGDTTDPIGHRPDLELAWLAKNESRYPIQCDRVLRRMLDEQKTPA